MSACVVCARPVDEDGDRLCVLCATDVVTVDGHRLECRCGPCAVWARAWAFGSDSRVWPEVLRIEARTALAAEELAAWLARRPA